jgi:hypothetical protein
MMKPLQTSPLACSGRTFHLPFSFPPQFWGWNRPSLLEGGIGLAFATWEGDHLTLYDATQYVSGVRRTVAKTLGVAPEKVRFQLGDTELPEARCPAVRDPRQASHRRCRQPALQRA